MRAVVASALSLSLLAGACFPNNAQHRMYAKLAEGGALAGGIALLYAVNSGADCDMSSAPGGQPDDSCKSRATVLGDLGLGLILLGLVGFIATVSTSEEDKPPPPVIVPKADAPKTEVPKATPTPTPTPPPTPAADPTPAPAGGGSATP